MSRKEQKKRFMERLDEPEKNWKFSATDVHERRFWSDYMHAFEEAIRATASKHAPWFVVPADNKWFTRVAAAIVEALEKLDLQYPKIKRQRGRSSRPARGTGSRKVAGAPRLVLASTAEIPTGGLALAILTR